MAFSQRKFDDFPDLDFVNLECSYDNLPISVLFVYPYSYATNRVRATIVFAATINIYYWIITVVNVTLVPPVPLRIPMKPRHILT